MSFLPILERLPHRFPLLAGALLCAALAGSALAADPQPAAGQAAQKK